MLRGQTQHDIASDLYSLGVIFCELLAGEIPKNLLNLRESLSLYLPDESHFDMLQSVIFSSLSQHSIVRKIRFLVINYVL